MVDQKTTPAQDKEIAEKALKALEGEQTALREEVFAAWRKGPAKPLPDDIVGKRTLDAHNVAMESSSVVDSSVVKSLKNRIDEHADRKDKYNELKSEKPFTFTDTHQKILDDGAKNIEKDAKQHLKDLGKAQREIDRGLKALSERELELTRKNNRQFAQEAYDIRSNHALSVEEKDAAVTALNRKHEVVTKDITTHFENMAKPLEERSKKITELAADIEEHTTLKAADFLKGKSLANTEAAAAKAAKGNLGTFGKIAHNLEHSKVKAFAGLGTAGLGAVMLLSDLGKKFSGPATPDQQDVSWVKIAADAGLTGGGLFIAGHGANR